MADKEIIIDGVNIIDCNDYYVEQETDQVKCDLSGEYCRENKNCFYKQLARKTQECEELKKEQLEIKKYLGISHKSILERLEELQERRDELSEKNLSYEQALEEIEEVLKDEICEECPGEEGCKGGCKEHQCLNIINKAKGEGNE